MDHHVNLVLHPGHSKCGSTSIQTSLYGNRHSLERYSIFVPDSKFRFSFEEAGEPSEPIQPTGYLQDLMTGRVDLAHFAYRLDKALARAEGAGCETILLSSENLCNLYLEHALDVHGMLAERFPRTRVIYYVRQQDDWILSAWQQWGHKAGRALDEWVDYCLAVRVPEFLSNANRLRAIYGEGSVSVLPVHRLALPKGGLLVDFYRRLGIAAPEPGAVSPYENRSINPYVCEILGAVCSAYPSVDDNSVKDLIDRISPRKPLYRRYNHYMGMEQRERILDAFEDENRELHRRFFGHLKFSEVFARPRFVSEVERNLEKVEGLKDVISVQMGLLLSLLTKEGQGNSPASNPQPPELSGWPSLPAADASPMPSQWPEPDAA